MSSTIGLVVQSQVRARGRGTGPRPSRRRLSSSSSITRSGSIASQLQAKDTWEMDAAEKVAAAGALKDKGNTAFKAGNFRRAIQQYDKALQAIE